MNRPHDRVRFEEYTGLTWFGAVLLLLPGLALFAGALWFAVQLVDPLPPKRVVLATGPADSGLHALGLKYAERMAADGIEVDVRTTRGAAENLALIQNDASRVDLAFLVGGIAGQDGGAKLVNIANLFHAPLWCVSRQADGEITLASLRGRRVAVGAPGSGLEAVLAPLLSANDVTGGNAMLQHLSPSDAVRTLADGSADAIFLADGWRSGELAEALAIPGARLMSFPRAAAYARRHSHLVHLTLPQGTLDLARNVPDRDLSLIGTTVMIAARSDVHPTVVDLVVDAARELHGGQTIFDRRGEFPNMVQVDAIPVSPQALLYAREGASLLRRYLPLWLADSVQRAIFFAIPLIAVAFPLVRVLPGVLDLLSRRHLFRGYAGLRRIERAVKARPEGAPVDDLLRDLARIEDSIAGVRESVIKAGELYTFRVHLRVVRDAVNAGASASIAAGDDRAEP